MEELDAGLKVVWIACLIIVVVAIVGVVCVICSNKTNNDMEEITKQIGVDYSNYIVLEKQNISKDYIEYISVKIDEGYYIYKVTKVDGKIIVELLK